MWWVLLHLREGNGRTEPTVGGSNSIDLGSIYGFFLLMCVSG